MCFLNHKWGKLDENNIQYCSKCGKARQVKLMSKCEKLGHDWVNVTKYTQSDAFTGIRQVQVSQQCSVCKEFRTVRAF